MPKSRKKNRPPKRFLALPDLEQSKAAVPNSRTSKSGQRSYDRAITGFVEWYCTEAAPRIQSRRGPPIPDLSRTEIVRTDNDQSATGGRSAGRLRGRRFGTAQSRTGSRNSTCQRSPPDWNRVGNRLTLEQGKRLLAAAESDSLRGKRNTVILAMLIGSGLRRGELLALRVDAIQLREEHWVIADLLRLSGLS